MHIHFYKVLKEKFSFIFEHKKILLAVSGGADSTAMAHLFTGIKELDIYIVIINHNLREESFDEALFVKSNLSDISNNIDIKQIDWKIKPKTNIQNIARKERYRILYEFANKHNIKIIATGHNQNDQAETILARLFKGNTLKPIPEIRLYKDIRIIRPLLSFKRDDIESYLKNRNLSWIEDPSNNNLQYERVKIRKLICYIKDQNIGDNHLLNRLSTIGNNLSCMYNFIDKYLNQWIKINVTNNLFYIAINWDVLHAETLIPNIIGLLIQKCRNKKIKLRSKSLKVVQNRIAMRLQSTLGGVIIKVVDNLVIFYREIAKISPKMIDINDIWDDRFIILTQNIQLKIGKTNLQNVITLSKDVQNIYNLELYNKFIKIKKLINPQIALTTPAIYCNNTIIIYPLLGIYDVRYSAMIQDLVVKFYE